MDNITIPDCMPIKKESLYGFDISSFHKREIYVSQGMYAFVSWKWVKPFAKWLNGRKCLEVMAGRGWLTYALRYLDVDVISTDDMSWHKKGTIKEPPITEMIDMDAIKAVKKYGKQVDVILMSWPYMDNTAYQVLKAMRKVNPNAMLVYIGESNGGCTADDAFFEALEEVDDDEFTNNVQGNFETWFGLHDTVYLIK